MSKLEIFKKIDVFVFSKIDEFQKHPEYLKLSDHFSNLEENVQEVIKMLLMLILFIAPLFVFFIVFSSNSDLKNELRMKEDIIKVSNDLIQKKALITHEERKILGPSYVGTESSFKNKIISLLSMISVNTTDIKVNNFDSEELDGLITKVRTDLGFNNMSSEDIFGMLNTFTSKGKMKIDEISIRKSAGNGLLSGMMTVLYYSKDTAE